MQNIKPVIYLKFKNPFKKFNKVPLKSLSLQFQFIQIICTGQSRGSVLNSFKNAAWEYFNGCNASPM